MSNKEHAFEIGCGCFLWLVLLVTVVSIVTYSICSVIKFTGVLE